MLLFHENKPAGVDLRHGSCGIRVTGQRKHKGLRIPGAYHRMNASARQSFAKRGNLSSGRPQVAQTPSGSGARREGYDQGLRCAGWPYRHQSRRDVRALRTGRPRPARFGGLRFYSGRRRIASAEGARLPHGVRHRRVGRGPELQGQRDPPAGIPVFEAERETETRGRTLDQPPWRFAVSAAGRHLPSQNGTNPKTSCNCSIIFDFHPFWNAYSGKHASQFSDEHLLAKT